MDLGETKQERKEIMAQFTMDVEIRGTFVVIAESEAEARQIVLETAYMDAEHPRANFHDLEDVKISNVEGCASCERGQRVCECDGDEYVLSSYEEAQAERCAMGIT